MEKVIASLFLFIQMCVHQRYIHSDEGFLLISLLFWGGNDCVFGSCLQFPCATLDNSQHSGGSIREVSVPASQRRWFALSTSHSFFFIHNGALLILHNTTSPNTIFFHTQPLPCSDGSKKGWIFGAPDPILRSCLLRFFGFLGYQFFFFVFVFFFFGSDQGG